MTSNGSTFGTDHQYIIQFLILVPLYVYCENFKFPPVSLEILINSVVFYIPNWQLCFTRFDFDNRVQAIMHLKIV